MQTGAGEEATCYPDFRNFTSKEIRKFIGLYIYHGLELSQWLEDKLRKASDDPVHGKFVQNISKGIPISLDDISKMKHLSRTDVVENPQDWK